MGERDRGSARHAGSTGSLQQRQRVLPAGRRAARRRVGAHAERVGRHLHRERSGDPVHACRALRAGPWVSGGSLPPRPRALPLERRPRGRGGARLDPVREPGSRQRPGRAVDRCPVPEHFRFVLVRAAERGRRDRDRPRNPTAGRGQRRSGRVRAPGRERAAPERGLALPHAPRGGSELVPVGLLRRGGARVSGDLSGIRKSTRLHPADGGGSPTTCGSRASAATRSCSST